MGVGTLRQYHNVPEETPDVGVEDMTVPQLRAHAKGLGIAGIGQAKKADLLEAIEDHEAEE